MSTALLIIDPQNDFCDPNHGSLYVPGAESDTDRLAAFIQNNSDGIDDIIVSLDSHQRMDISHPLWWRDAEGNSPAPFTVISADEVDSGAWKTARTEDAEISSTYVHQLAVGQRYPHVIWPEHCLVGHWGHNVWPDLHHRMGQWEASRQRRVHYVYKGTNSYTEHFSAIQAEVPDPSDPATLPQEDLIARIAQADVILIAGQARSHCVANTVRDLVNLRPELVSRLVLLTDTTSDVPGFEALGTSFVEDLSAMGMALATTETWAS